MADKQDSKPDQQGQGKADNDLTRSGRHKTEVNTTTVVEDRTSEAAERVIIPIKERTIQLENGTVLTSYDSDEADAA